jgi:hypothetical protein
MRCDEFRRATNGVADRRGKKSMTMVQEWEYNTGDQLAATTRTAATFFEFTKLRTPTLEKS